MGGRRVSAADSGRPSEFTQTLLARLGLPPDATPHDVETAHGRLVAFLDSAPQELRAWARQQAGTADAAFALLTDPVTDVGGNAVRDDREDEPSAEGEPDEGTREASDEESADGSRDELDEDQLDEDEFDEDHFDEDDLDDDEFDEDALPTTGSDKIQAGSRGARAGAATSGRRPESKRPSGSRRPAGRGETHSDTRLGALALPEGWLRRYRLIPIALILAVAAAVWGVYEFGNRGDVPPASPNASSSAQPVDQAKVAALMKQLDANPKDVDTLRALGDLYFQAFDYKAAATWQQKIVDINPKDLGARLALGAALFNTGDGAAAEKQWREVVRLDPKHAEAHYDLGFLYLSKNPPDMAKVKAEWAKVVESDPNSELAKTVSAHLQRLENPSPSPSASGK